MQRYLAYTAILLIHFLSFTKVSSAQTNKSADAILGVYQDPDQGEKISVYKQGEQYFGKISELPHTGGKATIGMIILKNLVYSNGQWTGQIYSPKRESDYSVTITLPDATNMALKASAGIFSKSFSWKRVP